jgi:hypothetical protein
VKAHWLSSLRCSASQLENHEMKLDYQRLSITLALALATAAATAASAHFVRGPFASLDSGTGNVTVTWKEAGLGDTTSVNYVASAVAAARYQCVNHGGRCPAAANKQDVLSNVSASGTFQSGKNGAINGSLTFEPPDGTLACPGSQVLVMVSVSYTNIALTDTTNGVSASASPSALALAGPECP